MRESRRNKNDANRLIFCYKSRMAGAPPTGAFPAPTHASTAAAAGRPFEIDDEPSAPNVAMPDAPPPPVPGADPSTENNNGDALMGGVSVGGDGQNGGKALMGEGAVKVRVVMMLAGSLRTSSLTHLTHLDNFVSSPLSLMHSAR